MTREERQALMQQLNNADGVSEYLTSLPEDATDDDILMAVRNVSSALVHRDCGARMIVNADGSFTGQLTGIVDLEYFQAETASDIWPAFTSAVAAYLGPAEVDN